MKEKYITIKVNLLILLLDLITKEK